MPRRLVNVYQLTRSNVPGGLNFHQHRSEKLKPRDVLAGLNISVITVLLVCSFVSIVQYKYLCTCIEKQNIIFSFVTRLATRAFTRPLAHSLYR
jgi:hypothetical protein